jgi:hypothetical protein
MRKSPYLASILVTTLMVSTSMGQDLQKVQVGDDGGMEFPESVTSTADGTLFAGSMTPHFQGRPGRRQDRNLRRRACRGTGRGARRLCR